MSDAITRSIERIESLRAQVLRNVERDRGYPSEGVRVRIADFIASAYDDAIRILREERTKP